MTHKEFKYENKDYTLNTISGTIYGGKVDTKHVFLLLTDERQNELKNHLRLEKFKKLIDNEYFR